MHTAHYRHLVPGVYVIKRLNLYMNLLLWAKIKCPLSILERVCIREVFFRGNDENIVGTQETVHVREVSVWRGVCMERCP